MVDSVHGRSGGTVPRTDRDGQPTAVTARPTVAARRGPVMRRRRLAPYLLLLPSAVAIGLVLVWPTIQIGLFSAQNYGLPQVTGSAPTQWVGAGNYATVLRDPEFWLSLRISVIFAAVVVVLTLSAGTLVGLLLH